MKKRVLFVDDEPLVLQALQRLLRPMREQWEMEFVDGGAKTLECLEATPCDAVVSDMMMPGMNGVQLLQRIRSQWPGTIRIVLSGHAEQQLAIQCVGVAHQFLSKPCDTEVLRSTIVRAMELGFAVRSEPLLNIVGRLEHLPSLRAVSMKLLRLLDNPTSTTMEIGALMESDTALAAQILKIANSAFFGLARSVNKPSDAVAYLGFDTLKAIVLTAGFLDQAGLDKSCGYSLEAAADHAQMVGAAARAIAETEHGSRAFGDECFIAGLLHDIGKLVLARNLPSEFAVVASADQGLHSHLEQEMFGASHAAVGAYLMGLWGLPNSVVEAIRLHHSPSEYSLKRFTTLTSVHVADQFVARLSTECGSASAPLDEGYLSSLGLADRIPVWRAAVEKMFSPQP